jgi:cytidine deaminase
VKGSQSFEYTIYRGLTQLTDSDQKLVQMARDMALQAYAPYSNFKVGAVALMQDGSLVSGTNQENASYPIGLCAERVLLAAVSSVSPGLSISKLAISYFSEVVNSSKPIAPCGICRQSLVEFESRYKVAMPLLLSGTSGEIFEFDSVSRLLPFAFTHVDLGK